MAIGGGTNKDIWDIVDIVVKGFAAIVISAGVAFFTLFYQEEKREIQSQIQEENRRAQALVQVVSSREAVSSRMRTQMFEILMKKYFGGENEDIRSQIIALEMIGLNFRDNLQLKPMFKHLDNRITDAVTGIEFQIKTLLQLGEDKLSLKVDKACETGNFSSQEGTPEYVKLCRDRESLDRNRSLLRKTARAVIREQLRQIELSAGGNVCDLVFELNQNDQKNQQQQLAGAHCFDKRVFGLAGFAADGDSVKIQAYGVYLEDDDEDDYEAFSADEQPQPTFDTQTFAPEVQAKIIAEAEESLLARVGQKYGKPFGVTYFDMPMVDYSRLPNSDPPVYYSLIMDQIKDGEVALKVAVLPPSDYSARNSYRVDELVDDLLSNKSQPSEQSNVSTGLLQWLTDW